MPNCIHHSAIQFILLNLTDSSEIKKRAITFASKNPSRIYQSNCLSFKNCQIANNNHHQRVILPHTGRPVEVRPENTKVAFRGDLSQS